MTTLRQDIEVKIAEHKTQIAWLESELAKGEAFLDREAAEIAHWFSTLVIHLQHRFTPVTSVTLEAPKPNPVVEDSLVNSLVNHEPTVAETVAAQAAPAVAS